MSRRRGISVIVAGIAVMAAVLAASCRGGGDTGRKAVMTSIPPLQTLTAQIAGDSLDVLCMTASDADPETYEPTMRQMRRLYESGMLLTVGTLPFEETLTRGLASEAPQIEVIALSDSLPLLYGTHEHCGHDHGHHNGDDGGHYDGDSHDHVHGAPDPHVWGSVRMMARMVPRITAGLCRLDPANTAYYTHRGDSIRRVLERLDTEYAHRLAPYRGDTIVVFHPSLSYFADDYGLHQLALSSEGTEGSIRSLVRHVEASAGPGVRALFVQQEIDPARAEAISADTGRPATAINPLSPEYLNQLNIIVNAITRP